MDKNTVGIEFPKGHARVELDQLSYNIDPQHGGHKMPCGDAPLPTDCALSWVFRNAMAIHDQMYRGDFPCTREEFACPKWDVDALLTAVVLAEICWAAYMGTGGSQHFFLWGDSPDKKLSERIELVRKLDTGELGQQLGDHPDLVGLARVAAGSRPLKEKIELGRDWLMGHQNDELTKETELARQGGRGRTRRALLAKLGRSESDFVAQLCAELGVEGGERTILVEIAKLKAKIDDRVAWDKRLKDGSAVCKGSMRLSTGCGQCVRCKEEVLTLITKNTELENERNTLRARVDAVVKALANAQFCVEQCADDVRKIAGLT